MAWPGFFVAFRSFRVEQNVRRRKFPQPIPERTDAFQTRSTRERMSGGCLQNAALAHLFFDPRRAQGDSPRVTSERLHGSPEHVVHLSRPRDRDILRFECEMFPTDKPGE